MLLKPLLNTPITGETDRRINIPHALLQPQLCLSQIRIMKIKIMLALTALLIGALIYASYRRPIKINNVTSWGIKNIENAKVTFKILNLEAIPKREYRFCLLAEAEQLNDIEKIGLIHELLNELMESSGHTVLTARIDYKNKVQWQFYSARPSAATKLLKKLVLPVLLRVGQIEDPDWDEYLFHSSKT
jgi:hypothetical protein